MDNPQKIWDIETGWAIRSTFKNYRKDHPGEYASVFANLDKVLKHLNSGEKLGVSISGFSDPREKVFIA